METESQNKTVGSHKVRNIILIILTVMALMGAGLITLYVVDYSNLNELLTADNRDLSDQIETKEEEIETSEDNAVSLEEEKLNLTEEKDQLKVDLKTLGSEYEDLIDSYDDQQEDLVELLDEVECPESLMDLDISYVSNSSVSKALKRWVETHVGTVIDADYFDYKRGSDDALHWVDTEGNIRVYFLVFFNDKDYGVVNAVYNLGRKCWLDGPWREFIPGESAKTDLPSNSLAAISPIQQEPFYTAVSPALKPLLSGL